jgi:hypothetical protein
MFDHAVGIDAKAGSALGFHLETGPDVHAARIEPDEKRLLVAITFDAIMSVAHAARMWTVLPSSFLAFILHVCICPRIRSPSRMKPPPNSSESVRNEISLPFLAKTLLHTDASVAHAPFKSVAFAGLPKARQPTANVVINIAILDRMRSPMTIIKTFSITESSFFGEARIFAENSNCRQS